MTREDIIYRFIPSPHQGENSPTLLLLHGTGGNEDDLLSLSEYFGESWNYLSPRGMVLENGMPRFFRRLSEGVFDQQDLKYRTAQLCEFLEESAGIHGFDPRRVIALGYSNGANIAASILLSGYKSLRHAILMHPMVPFFPNPLPDLGNTRILITAGENDPVVPRSNTSELEQIFTKAGAKVEMFWHGSGHNLTEQELQKAGLFAKTLIKSL
jgi:phospholipase/carboxylesterase